MFNKNLAISKNILIATCFILSLLFAANVCMENVHAIDVNETGDNPIAIGINEEDKLENSQENDLLQATKEIGGGTFSDIQNLIHYNVTDGDTIILNGEFTSNGPESHIVVYKNITFKSTSGAVLDGKNASGIFVVETGGSGSSFSNLVLKNGNGLYGGSMWIYGKDVKIRDCVFENNYASQGGGAICTDYSIDTNPDFAKNLFIQNCIFKKNSARINSGAIAAYGYNTRILNCTFDSNYVYNKNGGLVYGGAMQVGRKEFSSNSLIKDCKFINNKAISISNTTLSHAGASCIREGVTYENCIFDGNSADRGGALTAHCSATIRNCTFKNNSANDFGGALNNIEDTYSTNLKIIDCDFESNRAPYGGAIQLDGNSITIEDSNFNKNHASIDGGAIYINSKILDIFDSNFTKNDAHHNGGAIYVNGESTTVQGSNFKSNIAIANANVKDDGLGGAIYINGSSDKIKNNVFEFNVARNGSAVYYDKCGEDLTVTNNVMNKNQAWVYALPVYANDIYYGESEKIGAIIYGGNNIGDYDNLLVSNSIYNAALNRNIKINGDTPVSGATNSGEVYQDPREYNIDVLLTVKHSDGTVVYNNTLKSNYLGEVSKVLNNLKPGKYTLTARHYEDNYYKAITNSTTFMVNPKIDVKVDKSTPNSEYNYHDQVIWTVSVVNNGPNNATNVKVTDVLPQGLVYKSHTVSAGDYSNGLWTIDNLAVGKSAVLKITTLINKTGDITNKANASATELDVNMTNNKDSQKINVNDACDLAITKSSNVTSANYRGLVKWTLKVTNNGPDIAHNVIVIDNLPSGLILNSSNGNYASGKWSIGTLNVGQSKSLEIITLVGKTGTIKNTANVTANEYDYNMANNVASKSITVGKSADLQITKDVNKTNPNYGDLVKWTVTVRNNGPDAAGSIYVSDVLPAGLVNKSYTASKGSYANGVWSVGALANGASATLNIVCLVNKTGTIKNVVNVTFNEYDINKKNNNASKSITVPKACDLQVSKSVNKSGPNYGDLIKWTVTVRNNGPDAASGVNVSDVLPAGLVYKSYTASKGSYDDGVWSVGALAKGASATLNIVCLVNKTGTIKNVVSVTGKEFDYNMANNDASKSITVPKACDLQVTKNVNDSAPNYSKLVKWTVTVRNNGPDAASGVNVSDVLPAGLVYRSYTASKGSYDDGVWSVGALAKGASATLNIVCLVNKTGTIKNVVSVIGNEYDINMKNNDASKSISVPKACDLQVSKSVNKSGPNYGDLIKWTVTVRNNGPDAASGVNVSDVLPAGLVYRSYSASVGSFADGVWSVGALAKGASATLNIVCLVNKTGSIKNVVSVTGKEFDYNLANNEASKSITVSKSADLQVSKTVNNTSPNYADLVKWTVTVRNNGPDAASGVNVSDVLPVGLVYRSYTASVGNYVNGVWSVGALAKGASATLNIVCLVNKTGTIKNSANVTANEYDYNLANNGASKSITVPKSADLQVSKSVNKSGPNYGDLIKWTVTVRNNGPDAASGVNVSDVLPAGLVYRSFTASVGSFADGVWSVGALAKGASATLNIVCLVNKTGSIKNVVSVAGNEYDINMKNNNASKSITVPNASDLQVSKDVNKTNPNYGDLIKWTVTVRNNGPDTATGIKINDILPDGLIYQSDKASKGTYSDGVWDIDTLTKGSSATLTIVSKVNKTGKITNVVNVTGNEYDINKTNNIANKSILTPPAADLEIIKSVNVSAPNYHDLVKWTLIIKNNGPDDASEVVVNDILPNGLIVKSTTGNYSDGKFQIGSLKAFSSKTLQIITFVNKTGVLINNASVLGHEYDYNKSNNMGSSSINVSKAADLKISKIASNLNPNYKNTVKWIILVENNGPDKATNVKVNEILGEEFELISSSASKGYYINGIWDIGNMEVGERVNLEIITKINKTGNFTNVANVSGDEYDHNISNNEANKSITVNPAVDLEVTKKVNNTSPNYNNLVKWTVTVRNNGPDKANNIEITDILPVNLKFVSYKATKGFYEDGLWKFCCLENGEVANLEIITRVLGIGEIKNLVVANAKEYDYYPENNKDESSIDVAPASDLQMIKLVNKSTVNYKELVKWTLIVRNNGPSDATRVVVYDTLPEGLSFISSKGDGTFSTTGTWYVGNLENGKSKEINLITRADETGSFNNVATVSGDQYDFNTKNNKDEKSLLVNPAADLSIIKTVSKVVSTVGDSITYSIELTNNGPDLAENITVSEIMDDSMLLNSFSLASGEYDAENHVWNIKSLGVNEKTFLNIEAVSTKDGFVANKVHAVSDTFDFNLNNNVAEVIVEIIKKVIDPNNPFNPGLYSKLRGVESVNDDFSLVSKASVEMKETGIPVGLLMLVSLISLAFCNSNILKKR